MVILSFAALDVEVKNAVECKNADISASKLLMEKEKTLCFLEN